MVALRNGVPSGYPGVSALQEACLKVLKLSAQGLPQSWISLEQAVTHYACGEVRWESGGEVAVFHGGHNAITGQQSIIRVNSIIGTKGRAAHQPVQPCARPDQCQAVRAGPQCGCAYCGSQQLHESELTREHIIPFAQQGRDTWMNVVTPAPLQPPQEQPRPSKPTCLAHPYVPSLWEISSCAIGDLLADQMEF